MSVTLSLFAGAGAQFFDNNGNVLSGGKIYTYAAGTTTNQATYTSNSESAFHTNPIILDAAGRVPSGGEIWLTLGIGYKFVLQTASNVLIATYDNIPSSAQPPAANDADSIMYEQGYTVTAGSFVVGKIYRIVSVGTTNFTLIGATNNTVGTHFIATGAGTGTGTAELSQTVESRLRQVISVKDFGAVGDGTTDDTAAIQAAINTANWTYSTNTVVTESTATPTCIFFPQGTYRITSKLRLAPGLQLSGYSGGIHARTMEQANLNKKGTTILVDYENEVDYAIDTSGYAGPGYSGGGFVGQRIDNYPATGSSTASNTYAGCSGMRFENINFQAALGRKVRGMNLGLVPMLVMNNVQVHGFIVGIRIGGCWGGQLSNVRIDGPYGWRPLVLGTDVNNTTLTNVYISGQNSTGSIYTPPVGSVIGDEYWTQYEGIPALYSWMTRADLERSHGIWCRFAAVGAATLTVESTDVGIGLRDSRGDWDAVYMEGITTVLVADYGTGFGSKIDFTDVRSCATADVLWGIDSFTQMHLPESVQINSVIGGDNVGQWGNPYTATVPVITGIDKKPGETVPSFSHHSYNDGILFTPDSEASTTISGAATFYDATFGLVTDNREIDGVNWDWRGARVMRLDGMNSSSPVLQLTGNATFNSTGDGLTLRNSTHTLSFFAGPSNSFHPGTDNVISLGRAADRWTVVYAATGTINTSDARAKQQGRSLNDAECAVAVKIKGLLKAFKFNDAVEKKGDKARIHFGVYAQEVAEAFASEGLNAADYAMFCYDEWAATPAEVNPETNEIIHPAQEAGNRFGIRYEELLAFVIAAL
jgi:hypothetical protein